MAELYFNNYQTTIANGGAGYVAGSGVLNVLDTSPITLSAGDQTHLSIYTGSPELVVILKVTAVNSSTQFAVTAETSDTNASDGDLVINALSVGAFDQIRKDMGETFSGSLPTDSISGDLRIPTDDITAWLNVAGTLAPFGPYLLALAPPSQYTWTWRNQDGASVTVRNGSFFISGVTSPSGGTNLRLYETAVPGSTPYSIVIGMVPLMVSGNYATIGVGFDDGTKIEVVGISYDAQGLLVVSQYNSTTSFNTSPTDRPFYYASGPIFFKVRNDGTNIYFSVGTNPFDMIQVHQEAKAAFLGAITDFCVMLDEEDNGTGAQCACTVFYAEIGS